MNDAEPVPLGVPTPPATMSVAGRAAWDRLAPDRIAQGVLTAWDVDAFAAFCEVLAALATAHQDLGVKPFREYRDLVGLAVTVGAKFGWTPSDRAKLVVWGGQPGPTAGPERLLT